MIYELTSAQQSYLHSLGLSRDAMKLYEKLLRQKSFSATEAAAQVNGFASAQYRLFYELETLGLARKIAGRPRRYSAIPLDAGLPAAFNAKQRELRAALQNALGTPQVEAGGNLKLIMGRQEMYDEYSRLAEKAQHTICIFAIGIAYTPELVRVQGGAIKRGVSIRHVVQQLKPSNYHVVHTWQKLGVRVRLARLKRGFHLMVFDDNLTLVSFSDPSDTDDRLSIVTDNAAACRLFSTYFDDLWQDSAQIDS